MLNVHPSMLALHCTLLYIYCTFQDYVHIRLLYIIRPSINQELKQFGDILTLKKSLLHLLQYSEMYDMEPCNTAMQLQDSHSLALAQTTELNALVST